ncbi:hypothetical protein V2J09_022075 [Rumex salicifolius]
MKKSSLNFIFNLLLLLFSISQSLLSVNSQTDSCNNPVNFNDLVSFDTTSLSCQSVWDKEGFILRVKSNTWSFILSAPNKGGYVAIGFSKDGQMVGSSAMVGWPENGSTGMMKQYFLAKQAVGNVVPAKGDLKVIRNSTVVFVQSSRIYLGFQLSTSQPSDLLIFAYGWSNFRPRSPKYQLQYHAQRIATQLNYASGQVQTQMSPYAGLKKTHGVVNILSWGVFVPLGTLTARYFRRWDPIWFYSHVAIQTVGFILGLTGIILGMVLEGLLNVGETITRHKNIGVIVLVLGCLQVTALVVRPKKGSNARKYWNWYHHFAGRSLIILVIVNIFYGISLAQEGVSWSLSYGTILAVMTIVGIYLEIKLRREN